ncbi:MAG: alpha/beta fold hydrolase [Thermoleophilia bacterium]|nr:alpha/beta fold hydrolase [Thermoleophilia bacterium]
MRKLSGVALVSIVCALLGAQSADVATPTSPSIRGAAGAVGWRDCGEDLECATVWVPLDWDRPDGRQIKLAVIRHLASRPGKRIGSLFINPGGPGGSVDEVRADGENLDSTGRGRFNVVGWDIRGAGASRHVRCFRNERSGSRFFHNWLIPTTRRASLEMVDKTARLSRRCGRLSGRLLRHMSTADTARDLDYLRRLVGDQRLTYLGISGGTFIGQTYANMFPRRVRAMVLDGVLDPVAYTKGTKANYVNELRYADRAFAGFLSLCESAGPARCDLAGHGPVAPRVEGLFSRLRRAPIPAPGSPAGELTYGDALSAIVVNMSGSPGSWPEFAAAIESAAEGNGSKLAAAGRALTSAFSSASTAPGLPAIGLTCADSPVHQSPRAWRSVVRRLTQVSFSYGPVLSWWRWAPCASWPARSADRYTGPWDAVTKNPILVIGTRFDPNTPYADARRTARRLGNAVLLTHDGYSHTSRNDPSTCVKRAMTVYLIRIVTPRSGTICPSDRQPFDPDFGKPLAVP